MRPNLRAVCYFVLFILSVTALFACTRNGGPKELRGEMKDIYTATSQLFTYVWSPKEFSRQKSHEKILSLLDHLISGFHNVEAVSPVQSFEPGFRITLATHQALLMDVRKRFQAGDKEYANWQLRSLSFNCISCHTRYNANTDFIGEAPQGDDESVIARLAQAEFLIASRQFEKASANLHSLALSLGQTPAASESLLETLKLWLVVQVRAKEDFPNAAHTLAELIPRLNLSMEFQRLVKRWVKSLERISDPIPSPTEERTQLARTLLAPLYPDASIGEQEMNLVETLHATSLLHALLEQPLVPTVRREALYLLGVAYYQLPVATFETFRELYLEQCIREYPGSQAAQDSYRLYEKYLERTNSGSGGLHLDADLQQKLAQLKALAFQQNSAQLSNQPLPAVRSVRYDT